MTDNNISSSQQQEKNLSSFIFSPQPSQTTTTTQQTTNLLAQRLSPLLCALLKSFHAIPVRLKVYFWIFKINLFLNFRYY